MRCWIRILHRDLMKEKALLHSTCAAALAFLCKIFRCEELMLVLCGLVFRRLP